VLAPRIEDQADRDACQHVRQPDDVVGVRVARHHDVEPLDAEGRQLGIWSLTLGGLLALERMFG
jgi:hypothetical protein